MAKIFRYREPLELNRPNGFTIKGRKHRRVYTDLTVRKLLYNLVKREGGLRGAAAKIGISKAFLSQVLRGQKAPGHQIATFFKFERHIIYVRTLDGPVMAGVKWNPDGSMVDEVEETEGEEVAVDDSHAEDGRDSDDEANDGGTGEEEAGETEGGEGREAETQ